MMNTIVDQPVAARQATLQFRAVHTGHAAVPDQARGLRRLTGGEKLLGAISERGDEHAGQLPDRGIVVHDAFQIAASYAPWFLSQDLFMPKGIMRVDGVLAVHWDRSCSALCDDL